MRSGGAPGGIVAPPFAKKAGPSQPAAAASARPAAAGGAGPFQTAAEVPAGERKVTLVIDDSAVKEDEIGKKSRVRNIALIVIGLLLGTGFGFAFGSTAADRTQWNLAVRDGKDIHERINEVSTQLETAKGHLKKALTASSGSASEAAKIDYPAIEALQGMKEPVVDNEFHGRRYKAFPQSVVNDLFDYYNNIKVLWARFSVLGAKIQGENKRKVLDESAKAADDLMRNNYGMVLFKAGDAFAGGIVVMRRAQDDELEKKPEEGDPPMFMVSSKEGGREVARELFTGQEDFAEKYDKYVLAVDKGRSMASMGSAANLFGDLRGDLVAAQGLMDKTLEIQGRLLQELGKVAALKERAFF